MQFDCVVIGGGVSGLTGAILLARRGRRVALVERSARVAPLLRRVVVEGYHCDVGMHYFGGLFPGSGFGMLLRYLGVLDRLEAAPMDSAGFDEIVTPGGDVFVAPSGLEGFSEALQRRFPSSGRAVRGYVDGVRDLYGRTVFANPDVNPETFSFDSLSEESVYGLVTRLGGEVGLWRTLGAYGRILSGSGAREASMHTHCMVLGSYVQGAHVFRGGGDAWADALECQARSAGVEIFCGSEARRIEASERRVRAVEMVRGGEEIRLECGACLSSIHPKRLLDLLPSEAVRPVFARRVRAQAETFAPFILHVALSEEYPRWPLRNRYIFSFSPDHEADGDTLAVMAPGPEEGAGRTLCVIRKAWDNGAGAVFCDGVGLGRCRAGGRPKNGRYGEFMAEMREKTLEDLYGHYPGLRGRCRPISAVGPCDLEEIAHGWRGSTYGVRHVAGQRILSPAGPLHGLYLAGQGVISPGVASAVISGFLAAGTMLGWGSWWSEVQSCR